LKDADIPPAAFPALYSELILTVRKLFHLCRLVHADLSEYNILYHVEPKPAGEDAASLSREDERGHLYIIDVSQSVEHDHPHAFDFLRSDLRNVEEFFSRRGVRCLGLRRAFEFVTKESLEDGGGDTAALQRRLEESEREDIEEPSEDAVAMNQRSAADEDSVFMRSYIPRTLNEVYDPERDVDVLNRGEGEKLIYKDSIGLVVPKDQERPVKGARTAQFVDEHQDAPLSDGEESASDESGSESANEDQADDTFKERALRGHRHEDKEVKKVCP
jgi:RIO kinase 1